MASKKAKRRRSERIRKVLHITFLVILLSLIAAYGAGCFILRGKFLQNTYINGVDYGNLKADEAEAHFRETYAGRTLTLIERGGKTETISYEDIGYRLKTEDSFQDLIDQQNYLTWPLTYLEKTILHTTETFEYSESKLDAVLKKLDGVRGEVTMPESAHIEKTEAGFLIRDEILGNRILYKELLPAVEEAINNGETELDLDAAGVYMEPKVYASDEELQEKFARINQVQSEVISLYMEGGETAELTSETFLNWLDVDDDNNLYVSDERIAEYTAQLAEQYDTYLHERAFVTSEGDTVMVGGGNYDNYGYMLNQEESAVIIREALMSGISQTVALAWDKYALARDENGGDFGNTYIEISLDQQRMWYYKDGELVISTNVVTGTATPSRATPTGCFHVLQMLRDHTMQGSYGESYASYVIAIMTNGICIHDSSWRDEYGGEIYLDDGSHGCINTPLSAVETIYENVVEGTPVIIYDRDNLVPDVQNETYTGGENNGEYTADDEDVYDE